MPARFEATQLAPRSGSAFPNLDMRSESAFGGAGFAAPKRNSVMACVDGSPAGPLVFAHARAISNCLDSPLTLAQVVEVRKSSRTPKDPFEWQIICSESRAHLHHVVDFEDTSGEPVEEVLLHGVVGDEINRWATANQASLLVFATHKPGRSRTHMLGSTARRLLETSERSILLVPPEASTQTDIRYRRLLVPLDGSRRAENVLPVAVRIARQNDADIVLVHVVPTPEIFDSGPDDELSRDLCAKIHDAGEQMARHYLETLRYRLSNEKVRVKVIIAGEGDPRVNLRQIAGEQDADLIVMSAHGHTGLVDQPCGSVTDYLANHLSIPLLIVRDGFAEVPLHAAARSKQSGRSLFLPPTH